jgi:predicted transcriptional regulator
MPRSKLQLHLNILRVLGQGEQMQPTEIMYQVNICHAFLKKYLDLLIKQNLVERKVINGRKAKYSITEKGLDLLRYYGELEKALPMVEAYNAH